MTPLFKLLNGYVLDKNQNPCQVIQGPSHSGPYNFLISSVNLCKSYLSVTLNYLYFLEQVMMFNYPQAYLNDSLFCSKYLP